jgi:predicted O-methyltransferase YrrM
MRKTRLHNYNGQFLDTAGFLYLPKSILTTLSLKLADRRPELPWLGFRAIKYLDQIIDTTWKVLEFGSGMSTIWFARRCGFLVSIETDKAWYNAVTSMLNEKALLNVDYKFCDESEADVLQDYEESYFDLVLVDGPRRDRTMMTAILKVKQDGYIYLDNSDVPYQEHRTAKAMLISAAGKESNVKIFNDLYPMHVCVNEGVLASISKKPE